MIVANLLEEVSRLGITLRAEGSTLRYFPRQAMPTDLAARLKAHKADVLAVLRRTEVVIAAKDRAEN